jgi:Ca2+-transporting ATPase
MGILSNPMLAAIAILVVALQLAVIYIPFLGGFFDVVPLSATDISIAAGAGMVIFFAMELEKFLKKEK